MKEQNSKCYTTQSQGKVPRFPLQCVTFTLLLTLLVFLGVATFVYASDVSDAGYRGTITVTNNGSANTSVSTVFTLNTQSLIDTNKLNSSANDCAIQSATGTDVAFMPAANSTYPWVTWVPTIGEDATLYQYFYTSGVTGGKIRYFPGTGGMTTADSASLELGDNFSREDSGWIDTNMASDKNIVYKEDAFRTYISDDNSITSAILGITVAHEALTSGEDVAGTLKGADWGAQTFTPQVVHTISQVKLKVYRTDSPGTCNVSIRATDGTGHPTDGDLTSGTLNANTFTTDPAGEWYTWSLTPYELSVSTQYAIVVRVPSGDPSNNLRWLCDNDNGYPYGRRDNSDDSGVTWAFSPAGADYLFQDLGNAAISATGVSSGEHTVRTWADTSYWHISIDGVESDNASLGGISVPNNANNWTYFENMGAYWERTRTWVDGVLQQDISWQYATTFTDQSGNSHHTTPTFRTTSSDADVSANLTSFTGIMETTPPPAAGQTGWNILPSVPALPSGFFGEFDPASMTFWGSGYISTFSTATGIPLALIVFPYAFGIAIGAGFIAWYLSSGGGKQHNRGSLLAMAATSLIFMLYFVYGAGGVIPGWILLPFAIEVLVFIVWRQTPSPF